MSAQLDSIVIEYTMPLTEVLARLGLPKGDDYEVMISAIEGVETFQIAVTRIRMDGQSAADLLPEFEAQP